MPVTDRDILATAKICIQKDGDAALMKAMFKIAEHEANGDIEGRECWNKISKAIEWMQMPEVLSSESCH